MLNKAVFFLATIIFISSFSSVFAEVSHLQIDRDLYFENDSIYLDGVVTSDSSGLVTIVLRDPDNQFVLLSQAIVQPDDTFEKIIPIDSKFPISGTYNATAFILNMTEGKVQSFDVLLNDFEENIIKSSPSIEPPPEPDLKEGNIQEKTSESNFEESSFDIENLTYEKTNPFVAQKKNTADFVDPLKKPQYYLDRYYSEPNYKSWFDRNYPDLTIEEAVGFTNPSSVEITERVLENQIIPKAEATLEVPLKTEENKDIGILVFTIIGFGLLFGATYGIKRRTEENSKIIPINKNAIKKFFTFSVGSKPSKIIQARLAKGEITLEEYEKLKEKLQEN